MDLLRDELRDRRVELELRMKPDLPRVKGDDVQLQQVLLNLVTNSMEAIADASSAIRRITISTEVAGQGKILISVSDTGPGLNPNDAKRIFDPKFTTKREGMGMGLAISRSIVEAHAGSICALADQADGVTFLIEVPEFHG